ncbi:phage portal protein [Ureibacillus aquaedulcis]|uniref:Phage portal protein n=1 Tax=Ureibacillus aquaedulcis TaxID=3058421 RepID=A0ABT8GNF4_9BACL|nr:phage portal protein [Ureibacillus sp. BA0131]MDN4492889.1 phage portal protein [Ureibacillus sp. BA0131]
MGMFDFLKFEKRSADTTETFSSSDQAFTLDGLFNTNAITEEKVLKITTANACVNLISSQIAQMPVYLYREHANDKIEKIVYDERLKLLNHEPNAYLNGYNLKKHMVKDYLLQGATYVVKYEAGNKLLELHPLDAKSVTVNKRVQHGYRTVGAEITLTSAESGVNTTYNNAPTKFKPYELMMAFRDSKDGLNAKGLIDQGKEIFQQALAEMEYTSNLYENGALPLGLLKTSGRLNEPQIEALRASWKNLYAGVKNSAKTVVLQEGMEYEALSMNPNEIQMSETKKNTNSEICKLFNVPQHMVGSSDNAQYINLEQNLSFLKQTISPIIISLESAMDKSLLLESEKAEGYFFRFDTSEILRTTEKERIETLNIAVSSGIYTIDEARAKVDLPPTQNEAEQVLSQKTELDKGDVANGENRTPTN